jgi:hypothetical protein
VIHMSAQSATKARNALSFSSNSQPFWMRKLLLQDATCIDILAPIEKQSSRYCAIFVAYHYCAAASQNISMIDYYIV